MNESPVIKAVVKGNWAYCGKCGHKLFYVKVFGKSKVWYLCRHKSVLTGWERCMTLNEVEI